MSIQKILILMLLALTSACASDTTETYTNAKALWEKSYQKADYQTYAAEFTQFNNHFHLDEKDGCYALSQNPVELMLVITHENNTEFAVVEQVFSNVSNAKSECFINTYRGIKTKVPPFLPYVLQMSMG